MEEILHQLIGSLSVSHYLQGSMHPRWLFGISEPSTVSTKNPGKRPKNITPSMTPHPALPSKPSHSKCILHIFIPTKLPSKMNGIHLQLGPY